MHKAARNPFGSPGLRLVQLYILLNSTGRTFTLTRLAGLFHCSRQTVLRLMEQLVRVDGVEIDSWMHNRERYYKAKARSAPTALSFTADSLRHMMLCRDIVRSILPAAIDDELSQLLLDAPAGTLSQDRECGPQPVAESLVKGADRLLAVPVGA